MTENTWSSRKVLITGVCGTVGSELLYQVVEAGALEVIGLDNNETELFFKSEQYRSRDNVHVYLGDVRDRDKLVRKMRGVDVVLHAAALKHVILCEQTPGDAVLTNILGTENVLEAAFQNNVERVILTSSDKAVNPTNVMGTSKLMGERLVAAANAHRRYGGPVCSSTRFGNVLGSRGSVIPLFKRQIASGGPVTLTHPDMTRFIMTHKEAVRLVMESVFLAKGGEVFVTKMSVARVIDLAEIMVEELAQRHGQKPEDVEIEVVGSRPGEKMYEELMSAEEVRRAVELERYFAIAPAFPYVYRPVDYSDYEGLMTSEVDRPYNSSVEPALSKEELRSYLLTHKLLESTE